MIKLSSIQSRLAAGLSVSLLVLLAVQWVVVGISIRYLSEGYIASHLIQDAEALLAALSVSELSVSGDVDVYLDKSKLGPVFSRPFSGQYYKVTVGDNIFRSRSLWDTDLLHSPEYSRKHEREPTKAIVAGPQTQILLQVTRRYTKKSQAITISVAEDLTNVYKDITEFQIRYGIVSLAVALILLAVQAYIVRKNLKPLEKIRRELMALEKGVVNQLQEDVPTEVLPLVRELNYQLKAFAQRLDRSRDATGNLAHALKTPLSLLTQIADDTCMQQNQSIRDTLLQSVNAIEQTINRELKRARIAGAQLGGRNTEVEPEIQSLVDTLRAIYHKKQLNIHYNIPPKILCKMDRQDLLEMLGNVLDNACKWAESEVLLTIDNNHALTFIIEDDGAGCTADQIENLTKRGVRLDEQISGHGLGLSIVQGIVDDYDGDLKFSDSKKLGGLKVQILIPARAIEV